MVNQKIKSKFSIKWIIVHVFTGKKSSKRVPNNFKIIEPESDFQIFKNENLYFGSVYRWKIVVKFYQHFYFAWYYNLKWMVHSSVHTNTHTKRNLRNKMHRNSSLNKNQFLLFCLPFRMHALSVHIAINCLPDMHSSSYC